MTTERRQGMDRRQHERRQPTEVPEGVQAAEKGGTHALHVFTRTPQHWELVNHEDGKRWVGTMSGWRQVTEPDVEHWAKDQAIAAARPRRDDDYGRDPSGDP